MDNKENQIQEEKQIPLWLAILEVAGTIIIVIIIANAVLRFIYGG